MALALRILAFTLALALALRTLAFALGARTVVWQCAGEAETFALAVCPILTFAFALCPWG